MSDFQARGMNLPNWAQTDFVPRIYIFVPALIIPIVRTKLENEFGYSSFYEAVNNTTLNYHMITELGDSKTPFWACTMHTGNSDPNKNKTMVMLYLSCWTHYRFIRTSSHP